MSHRRPHFSLLGDILKVSYGKKFLLCRISDAVLAGVAVLVS